MPDLYTSSAPALSDFPVSFEQLRTLYDGFTPDFEPHRVSLSEWLSHLRERATLRELQEVLGTLNGGQPPAILLQRHFYWSATCLIRAFDLMLAVLTLERSGLWSWALTTGYYSRFYLMKALTNLWLASWVNTEIVAPEALQRPVANRDASDLRNEDVLLYWGTEGPRILRQRPSKHHREDAVVPAQLADRGSHQRWWKLAAELQHADMVPDADRFAFVLNDSHYSLEERTRANYSDRYLEGFPELDWFDHTSARQMLAHANSHAARTDRDFTDINRYFAGYDPELADAADFYTDSAQVLWCGVLTWLDSVRALGIPQSFVTSEKLITLATRALKHDFPFLLMGMETTLSDRAE